MDRGRGEAALALARLFQCAPCPYLASGSAVASDRWDDVTNPFCDAVKLHRAALARSSSTVEALKCCSRSCFNGTGACIKGALRNLHYCQMEGNKAPVVLFLLVESAATTCLSVDIEPCLPFCLGREGAGALVHVGASEALPPPIHQDSCPASATHRKVCCLNSVQMCFQLALAKWIKEEVSTSATGSGPLGNIKW